MGLSDNERTEYIYEAVSKMVKISREIKPEYYDHELFTLKNMVEKELWPSILGSHSNGAHWLLGSSATNKLTHESNSPFAIAMMLKFDEIKRDMKTEREKIKDPTYEDINEVLDNKFDPMDNLTISNLLGQYDDNHFFLKNIYDIFAWTEQLTYALRRYDDDYRKSLEGLSDVISRIQGECYNLFKDHNFQKAYVLHNTCEILFGYGNREKLRKILENNHAYHDLSIGMDREIEVSQLVKWYDRAKKYQNNLPELVYLAFEMIGRRMHYDHIYEAYLKDIKKAKIKVDEKRLKEIFDKNVKEHKRREKESSDRYSNDKAQEEAYIIGLGKEQ